MTRFRGLLFIEGASTVAYAYQCHLKKNMTRHTVSVIVCLAPHLLFPYQSKNVS